MGSSSSSSSSPPRRLREPSRIRSDSPTLRTDNIGAPPLPTTPPSTSTTLHHHTPSQGPTPQMFSASGATPSQYPMSPSTAQSPAMSYSDHHVDYTTYPEVVEAERAADSSPQVRTTQHFPEDHSMASKMPVDHEQRQYNSFAGAGVAVPQSPTTTVSASTKDAAVVAETKALPAVPPVPAAYGGNGGGGVAAEGGNNKTYSRKVVYVLIGLLILVMVLAGAIGGAVGSKAVNDAKTECLSNAAAAAAGSDSPTTTTPTSTTPTSSADMSQETFTVPTTGFVQLDCPSLDGETSSVDMGTTTFDFDLTCGASFSRGANSDIIAIISYSFYHCLQACASYNQKSGRTVCVGAEFDSDLSVAFEMAGNCFLSNSTSKATAVGTTDKNQKLVGVLQTASGSS